MFVLNILGALAQGLVLATKVTIGCGKLLFKAGRKLIKTGFKTIKNGKRLLNKVSNSIMGERTDLNKSYLFNKNTETSTQLKSEVTKNKKSKKVAKPNVDLKESSIFNKSNSTIKK